MTNLDIILKSRDITLPTKVHLAMVFPVVMYGCESWTVKEAECQRINAFELWCWRRLLRVPRTARRSNQLILKEINPEYSLEGLMLKLQYFGYFMQGADSLKRPWYWERLKQREKGVAEDDMVGWHHLLYGHGFSKLQETLKGTWHAAVHGVTKSWTRLSKWTTTGHLWTMTHTDLIQTFSVCGQRMNSLDK